MKKALTNKILYSIVLACLIIISITGIIYVKEFVGWTYVPAEGGALTEMKVDDRRATWYWQGIYGIANMEQGYNSTQSMTAYPGEVTEKHLFFNCLSPFEETHEVYASTNNSLDWSEIKAGTIQMVNEVLNLTGIEKDSANNTFTENISIMFGATNITMPGTYTYVNGAPSTKFDVGILNVSGELVFVAHISSLSTSYKGSQTKYQMILPVPNSSLTYYFYTDPNDDCPAGYGLGALSSGYIAGNVTDITTWLPIENASIYVGYTSNFSDVNGFYNFTALVGDYKLVAIKDGYNTYIGDVNISLSATTYHYINMTPFKGPQIGNGTLSGKITDNTTLLPIQNAIISIAGRSTLTDANGNYSLNVSEGTHNLVITKSGYKVHVGNATITYNETTTYNANLSLIFGNVNGTVIDSSTGLNLADVTITIAGYNTTTDSNGHYTISAPSGHHNIKATKTNYKEYSDNLTVFSGLTTIHNISLTQSVGPQIGNGTIRGHVTDFVTAAAIPDANITVYGKSVLTNASGYYAMNITSGTHNVFATKEDYYNHTSQATIYYNQTTNHDIQMIYTRGYITGIVTDSSTGFPVESVLVSSAGNSTYTDSNGNYTLNVTIGTHTIATTKSGYIGYAGNITVSSATTTYLNMTIVPSAGVGAANGTITGLTLDNDTGLALPNVTISIDGRVIESDSNGNYSVDVAAGSYKIIGIKSGYNTFVGDVNISAGKTTYYNFSLGEYIAPTSFTGIGTGIGEGTGTGTGTSEVTVTKTPRVEKPKKEIDYELSIKHIIVKIRVGNYIDVPISITNHKADTMSLEFKVEGSAASLIKMDQKSLEIDPDATGEITLRVLGNVDPGIYEGNLIVTGDIEDKVPIDILVYGKDKLQIETLLVKLELLDRSVYTTDNIKFKVDLQNLLREEQYKVSLSYFIEEFNGTKHYLMEQEEVILHTSFSLLKNLPIPEGINPGNYLLSVEAVYLDEISKHSAIFEIMEPFYKYRVFGLIPLWILLAILGGFILVFLLIFLYKRRKAKKKRYKIDLEWAEMPKAGPRSAYVGQIAETTTKTYFDLDNFQVHTIIAGASGSGKTIVAQDLAEEALMKGTAVVVFDPTATWTGFLRKCDDKKILDTYAKYGMKKADAKGFNGNVYQVTNAREIIDFKKFMKPGEINIFVTNKLSTEETEIFVNNTVREIFHADLPESKQLKFLMIYDGVHNLLPKFGGSGKVFVQLERATREFRKWGVGIMLLSQVLSDFSGAILANINTEIQMRTRDEGDLKRVKTEYGDDVLKSVVKAAIGAGMVESSAYNKGKPYFVAFRPVLHSIKRLSDKELENYNKYNAIIDDLEYQIEQLKDEKLDVFDLQLELKLAKDKIKSGNFNMVNIYLEGLTPRIKSQWTKLGKQPKKREIKLVSEDELEEEIKEAEKEEKKIEKEEGKSKKKIKEEEKLEKEIDKEEERLKEDEEKIVDTEQRLEEYKGKIDKEIDILEKDKETIESEEFKNVVELLKKAYGFLKNDQKDKASEIYSKIQELYKDLPAEVKQKILEKCLDLQKRISS